jgi:hypothetical protein
MAEGEAVTELGGLSGCIPMFCEKMGPTIAEMDFTDSKRVCCSVFALLHSRALTDMPNRI